MKPKRVETLVLFFVSNILVISGYAQQNTVIPDYPNNYTMYENLVQMPDGRRMGSGNAIDLSLIHI